jgi:hypothetical protein
MTLDFRVKTALTDVSLVYLMKISALLIKTIYNNKLLFSSKEHLVIFNLLIGFILFDLLVYNIPKFIRNNFNINTNLSIGILYDIFTYGFVFIFYNLTNKYLYGIEDPKWFFESFLIILIYSIFNILKLNIPKYITSNILYSDLLKYSVGYIITKYILYRGMPKINIYELVGLLLGIIIYHLIVKDLITKPTDIYRGGLTSLPSDVLYDRANP